VMVTDEQGNNPLEVQAIPGKIFAWLRIFWPFFHSVDHARY